MRLALLAVFLSYFAHAQDSNTPLAITNAVVQRAEDGPAISTSFKFLPGEFIHFTFQIAGFQKTLATETRPAKITLSFSVAVLDKGGIALAQSVNEKIAEELSPEDKDWAPKRRVSFQLPSFVAAGEYRIHVEVKDESGKDAITGDYPFQIGGPPLLPAEIVVVQGFQFFRTENDREPLDVPAYQPGDHVIARFRIAGFKKAEENRYQLSYRVTVLRPDGKPFLRDTQNVDLESKTFYPAPYVPADIELTTSKDSAKGQYQLIVSVRDLVANKTGEFRTSFGIE